MVDASKSEQETAPSHGRLAAIEYATAIVVLMTMGFVLYMVFVYRP